MDVGDGVGGVALGCIWSDLDEGVYELAELHDGRALTFWADTQTFPPTHTLIPRFLSRLTPMGHTRETQTHAETRY